MATRTQMKVKQMVTTHNDLPEQTRTEMVGLLNQELADVFDLFSQTKQAHWNVVGKNFRDSDRYAAISKATRSRDTGGRNMESGIRLPADHGPAGHEQGIEDQASHASGRVSGGKVPSVVRFRPPCP